MSGRLAYFGRNSNLVDLEPEKSKRRSRIVYTRWRWSRGSFKLQVHGGIQPALAPAGKSPTAPQFPRIGGPELVEPNGPKNVLSPESRPDLRDPSRLLLQACARAAPSRSVSRSSVSAPCLPAPVLVLVPSTSIPNPNTSKRDHKPAAPTDRPIAPAPAPVPVPSKAGRLP